MGSESHPKPPSGVLSACLRGCDSRMHTWKAGRRRSSWPSPRSRPRRGWSSPGRPPAKDWRFPPKRPETRSGYLQTRRRRGWHYALSDGAPPRSAVHRRSLPPGAWELAAGQERQSRPSSRSTSAGPRPSARRGPRAARLAAGGGAIPTRPSTLHS
jgi:hypothetical protein